MEANMEANKENGFIKFFQNRKIEVALFIALVATSKLTGIGFGLLLGFAIFLWSIKTISDAVISKHPKSGKTLAAFMKFAVFVVLVYSFVAANLHRASNNSDVTWGLFDQWITSNTGDRTEMIVNDMYKETKEEQGKIFAAHYRSLLSQKKYREAQDTLDGFRKVWSIKDEAERQKNSSSQVQLPPTQPTQPQSSLESGNASASEELKPGFYEYHLKKGEMTGWKQIPGDCIYDIMCYANQVLYRVYYSDGTVVDFTDGVNKELPEKTMAKFRISSLTDQTMKVNVMPRKRV